MQDVAFFDKETNTGEIIERISVDTITIQDAISEKVWLLRHRTRSSQHRRSII